MSPLRASPWLGFVVQARMIAVMTPLDSIPQGTKPSTLCGFVANHDEDELTQLLLRQLFTDECETLILAGFDSFERLVHIARIDGDPSGRCTIAPRRWRSLLDSGAAAVLMAHNHLSGDARPSATDRRMTRDTAIFLRTAGIELIDHLIVVAQGHFSFRSAEIL